MGSKPIIYSVIKVLPQTNPAPSPVFVSSAAYQCRKYRNIQNFLQAVLHRLDSGGPCIFARIAHRDNHALVEFHMPA